MCGRFTMITNAASLTSRYKTNLTGGFQVDAKYNIAPGQYVPVVTAGGIERMRWGLVPQWAASLNTGYSMFNAMAETLLEKRSYSQLIASRRCIVPASGFYEWITDEAGAKLPVYFKIDGHPIFSMAGIYTERTDPEGEVLKSFTIITTTPNDAVLPVHDRMPAILLAADEQAWLRPETDLSEALLMLGPYPDGLMTSYRVDASVNSAKNEGEQLILPINDAEN